MTVVRNLFALEQESRQRQTVDLALRELGFSQNEITLYRTALSLGPRPASTLAKSIKVQRTRVYDLLSSLQAKGLVEMVERNSVRYFVAAPPDNLLTLVRERKRLIEDQLNVLEEAVPVLFENLAPQEASIESRSVRGARQVQALLEAILLSSDGFLLAIGDLEEALESHADMKNWFEGFRRQRIERAIQLKISVQGPSNFLVQPELLREVLSSPNIPRSVLALASQNAVLFLNTKGTILATRVESKTFCQVLNGLYHSWLNAAHRIE